ncbi:MAG: NADH-ubiquinone oxidoreductase-F iron-sulfur binding region domain-containing protein [Moorellales bacterium]
MKFNQEYLKLQQQARRTGEAQNSRPLITVGTATCGRAAGALRVVEAVREEVRRLDLEAKVLEVGCLGHCYAEPLVTVRVPGFPGLCYGPVDEDRARRLVTDFLVHGDPCLEYALAALEPNELFPTFEEFPRGVYEQRVILALCGLIDPTDLDAYLAQDGYAGLACALEMSPREVIEVIKRSGLRGRGGAGFPTGAKWEICAQAGSDLKYVICNADEGDPGAFMDRALIESNPHQLLEGLAIAAYAVGAPKAIIYVRAEYPLAVARLEQAVTQARERGLLGKGILGTGFDLELEIFRGAGAFVCGEETALIASLEGRPGIPRPRPPYPAVAGLFGRPTLVNNVKTLCYVPHILRRGADWFRSLGTANSPGTAVFALAGKVANPGLVEVPLGTTLRELIFEVGGGIRDNKEFKAVQIGGPSGGCLPESALDLPIDFDSLQAAGAMMGSGGVVVLDEEDCVVETARYFLEFTQKESCGLCTFCRLGTAHLLLELTKITRGEGRIEDLDRLQELAEDVQAGSLCGLGQTAPNPVLTTLRYFRAEYEAHLREGRCPAGVCRELIIYDIVAEHCSKLCNLCVGSCPTGAIFTRPDMLKAIDQEKCVKCNQCLVTCPPQYRAVVKLSPPPKREGAQH